MTQESLVKMYNLNFEKPEFKGYKIRINGEYVLHTSKMKIHAEKNPLGYVNGRAIRW